MRFEAAGHGATKPSAFHGMRSRCTRVNVSVPTAPMASHLTRESRAPASEPALLVAWASG